MEKRPFGKTGLELPILSLGCQRLVDEEGCGQEQAVAILERALKRGVWYFDTAPAYSEGESERRVELVAIRRRTDMWIATKVNEITRTVPVGSSRRVSTDCRPTTWKKCGCTTSSMLTVSMP